MQPHTVSAYGTGCMGLAIIVPLCGRSQSEKRSECINCQITATVVANSEACITT